MGISFSGLIKGTEISFDSIRDRKIAVDSFNWMYQFLSTIRQMDGQPLMDSKGRITSHLSGIFYRSMKLLESGTKPVYVFDGKPPEIKRRTSEMRREKRMEERLKWKKSLEKKDYEQARKHAMRSSQIDNDMVEESKSLLNAMGIPCIQATSEGEKLCASLVEKGSVFAAATQDYDSLLFKCSRVVRNLSISGKKRRGSTYVEVTPEMLKLDEVLENLNITQDQLIMLGMMIGTDYNPGGIEGYGPKKSLKLVSKLKTIDDFVKNVEWKDESDPVEIFDFFKSKEDIDYEISFNSIDKEKIRKILCDDHEFSEKRIDNAFKRLDENLDLGQKSLGSFIN